MTLRPSRARGPHRADWGIVETFIGIVLRASRRVEGSVVLRYGLATALIGLVVLVRSALLPDAGDRSPYLAFIVAILASALVGGFRPGVYATAISAGLAAALYIEPVGQLWPGQPDDLVRLALYLAQGLLASAVGAALRFMILRHERLLGASSRLRALLHLQRAGARSPLGEPLVERLSDRELEVVRLLAIGLRNDEIADTLYVTGNTVKTHLAHAYGKLGVRSRTEAIARCAALGLLKSGGDGAEHDT